MFNGQKMRSLRKQKSLSMASLGSSIGISESYVSLIETGKRDCPDGKVLFLMCKELECQPIDLTDDKLLLAFAESFARQAAAPPRTPMARTNDADTPTTYERELVFLRSEVDHLRTENFNLLEQLARCQENLASALNVKGKGEAHA